VIVDPRDHYCREPRVGRRSLPVIRAGKKARARRSSSTRLGPARRSERARAEPVFVAREKSEPARELARGSTQQQFVT
jgi:hypothetical protein